MTGQSALQPEKLKATQTPASKPCFIVEDELYFEKLKEVYQAIEQRAYERFQERGGGLGADAEDWFCAESELLLKVPVDLSETASELVARAELPGFDETAIKVSIAPFHILIHGKVEQNLDRQKDEPVKTGKAQKELWSSVALPCEIETSKATATFKEGHLELSLPKRVAA
jgi:HSP20 family molecular chaperone IbpA